MSEQQAGGVGGDRTPELWAKPPAGHEGETRLERNVRETRHRHLRTPYFEGAEAVMDRQWANRIEPLIRGADFACVLELAPGHGRNTAKLRPLSREMYLVDVNEHCIEACRRRFGDEDGAGGCRMRYHVNDGRSLGFVPDGAVTLVYSWDSMVHFDRTVVEAYVREFARVMAPGARGFVHHSNYGELTDRDTNWVDNPHWRSTVTAGQFRAFCEGAGLRVDRQERIAWGEIQDLDCITLFGKPG